MNFDKDLVSRDLRPFVPEDWAQYKLACESTKLPAYDIDALELGLCGEVGELLDCIKKLEYHRDVIDYDDVKHQLKLEIGDVLWYMTLLGFDGAGLEERPTRYLVMVKMLALHAYNVDLPLIRSILNRIMGYYRIEPNEVIALNRQKLEKRYRKMHA